MKEDVQGIPMSTDTCPIETCGGRLTKPYPINAKQYAVSCTSCPWFIVTEGKP